MFTSQRRTATPPLCNLVFISLRNLVIQPYGGNITYKPLMYWKIPQNQKTYRTGKGAFHVYMITSTVHSS